MARCTTHIRRYARRAQRSVHGAFTVRLGVKTSSVKHNLVELHGDSHTRGRDVNRIATRVVADATHPQHVPSGRHRVEPKGAHDIGECRALTRLKINARKLDGAMQHMTDNHAEHGAVFDIG